MESIITQIRDILSPAGYYLKTTENKPFPNAYIFQIFTNHNIMVSTLVIHIKQDMIKTSSTRNAEEKDMTIFDIKTVYTTPDFRGRGFASILIPYGLCTLKKSFPKIDYAVLDDHTGHDDHTRHAQNMTELYSRFGFSTQYPTELVSNKTIKINDSGKQVKLDNFFVSAVNKILSNIKVSTLTGMSRKNKNRKTKTEKQKNTKTEKQKQKNTKTKKQKQKNKKTQKQKNKNTKNLEH
jgi:hypothetical protein